MPIKYGVLKGTVAGHMRDADDDHYQVLVHAGKTVWRVASNVKSSAPKAPSTVLFYGTTKLPDGLVKQLDELEPGFRKLPSKPNTIALDYVRGGLFDLKKLEPLAPDEPGEDNDLKDALEKAVLKAISEEGSFLYAFGDRWGPEPDTADKYFKFLPGNGVHDIHMNQGNSGKYKKDNGAYQDGALVFQYPGDKWRAFFFAFQSQTFETDDEGNPIEKALLTEAAGAPLRKKKSKAKKSAKKKRQG